MIDGYYNYLSNWVPDDEFYEQREALRLVILPRYMTLSSVSQLCLWGDAG